jgi:hypothetical protein
MQNGHEIYRITDILIQPFDDFDEVNNEIFIFYFFEKINLFRN